MLEGAVVHRLQQGYQRVVDEEREDERGEEGRPPPEPTAHR